MLVLGHGVLVLLVTVFVYHFMSCSHPHLCWYQKTCDYPFMGYQNIGSMFFRFVTKHACDGRTELRSTIPLPQNPPNRV